MEEENQVIEPQIEDESVEDEPTEEQPNEDVEALKKQLEEANEAKRQLTARAKKAEEEAKKYKPKEESQQRTDVNQNTLSKEETELIVLAGQGLTDPELVNELKALAKVRGKSLIETTNDPIFVALKTAKEEEAKKESARLGAGKGSGTVKKKKDFNTPGLSTEEHKALWKQDREQ